MDENKYEHVTAAGKHVQLLPISTARIRAASTLAKRSLVELNLPTEPPTHPVDGVLPAPGVEMPEVPYDDETIENAPDDIKEKYRLYKVWLKMLKGLTTTHMLRLLVLRGTRFPVPDDGWEELHEKDGMDVPKDPDERYFHYMVNEVLIPPVEAQLCVMKVFRLSVEGSDEVIMEHLDDLFRRKMEDQRGKKPGTDQKGVEEGGLVV